MLISDPDRPPPVGGTLRHRTRDQHNHTVIIVSPGEVRTCLPLRRLLILVLTVTPWGK
ncbi:hypothetical protein AVEN_9476-1, partial [Araneus ventricosus]